MEADKLEKSLCKSQKEASKLASKFSDASDSKSAQVADDIKPCEQTEYSKNRPKRYEFCLVAIESLS